MTEQDTFSLEKFNAMLAKMQPHKQRIEDVTLSVTYNVVPSLYVTEPFEDWSSCRSPARAKRREKKGHTQNVKRGRKPGAVVIGRDLHIHPDLLRELEKHVGLRFDAVTHNLLSAGRLS